MIDIPAGSYIVRTASVFDYNGDYTFMFVWSSLAGAGGGVGVLNIGQDDLSDYDILEAEAAHKLWGLSSTLGGPQEQTSKTTTAISTDGTTKYYTALRRTGTTVDVLIGLTPAGMTQEATGTLSDASRAAANEILFNGYQVVGAHNAVGYLGRVRAYTTALTDAQIKTEMAFNQPVITSGLWGNWPLPDNTNLNDDSGNARHFTAGGGINNGPSLPDEGMAAAIGGTLGGSTEAQVVAGGRTITITLTGDTFIP
jgi:hypothetical protein